MASPGTTNMAIGGLVFVGGSFVTLVTMSAASGGGRYIVAWGAIAFGAIQFLAGLGSYVTRPRSLIDNLLRNATLDFKALLRAVVAAAQSDGPLDARKIGLIQSILKQVDNEDHPAKLIEDMAAAMRLDKRDTTEYLAAVQRDFTAATKQLILRACVAVMATGSVFTESSDRFLRGIARALDMSEQQYGAVLKDMLRPVSSDPAARAATDA